MFLSCDFKTAKDYFTEAEQLEEQGKYKEAISILDKAILKDNKLLGAYINRGANKSAIGDFKGAIATAEQSIASAKEAKNDDYVTMAEKLIADLKK